MTKGLEGGCACGEVRYRLGSEPMFVHCCHCLNCQRHTGSAFVINMLIETARVKFLAGRPEPIAMPLNGGSPKDIHRCHTCKVAVWSINGGRSQLLIVRAGTLDDPTAVTPDVHIFTRSKLPWVALPEGVPAYEVSYKAEELWPAESLARRKVLFG